MMRKLRRRKYRPILRFTPYAWAKLQFLRDLGQTEIGGFGIAREGDPLCIEDLALVRQRCTAVAVKFDDASVADYFDEQIDLGRKPEQFARVWIHTHPGDSAQPSLTDERTFARAFGHTDWAVMAILARGGETSARLRFNCGPRVDLSIDTSLDWSLPLIGSDSASWAREYAVCVQPQEPFEATTLEPLTDGQIQVATGIDEPELRGEPGLWDAAFW